MSSSYSTPLTYGTTNYPLTYENPQAVQIQNQNVQPAYEPVQTPKAPSGPSSLPAAGAGVALGAITGGIVGAKKNPCIVDGNNINDKFASKVYEKYVKKVPGSGVNRKQIQSVLSKIDSVKTPEELKTLLADNKDVADVICKDLGITTDEFLDNVTNDNLKSNKKVIKNNLKAADETKLQHLKNNILKFWDKDKKKFDKGANPDKELYKAIKSSSWEMKAGGIAKAVGIGAAIGGSVLFVIHKLLTRPKNVQKNQY